MKKILVVNTVLRGGGAAKIAQDIFGEGKKIFGDQIWFAYGRGKKSAEEQTFYFGNKIELFFHIFLVRFLGLEGFGSFFATRKLIKFIQKNKFTAVHVHNLHGYYVNFFYLLKWLNEQNIPVVWTIHDEWPFTWLPAHSMGCVHCQGGEGVCTNQYGYPKNYVPIGRQRMIRLKHGLFRHKNIMFVSPAEWLRDKVKEKNPNASVRVVYHGIDLDTFKPMDKLSLREKYRVPKDKKVVLFSAANLKDKNKGVEYVVNVVEAMKKKGYIFISIGEGRVRANVTSFGKIDDQHQMAELYALSDVYFLSSLAESVSLTMMEALASSVPVVAFAMPATQVLKENQCGFLIPDKSNDAISETLEAVTKDNEQYIQMSLNGRKVALARADRRHMLSAYSDLYQTI